MRRHGGEGDGQDGGKGRGGNGGFLLDEYTKALREQVRHDKKGRGEEDGHGEVLTRSTSCCWPALDGLD